MLRASEVSPSTTQAATSAKTIEVCFVLDTTGSMSGLIEGAKAKIWAIANQVVKQKPTPDVKFALIGYRDRGDAYVTQRFDLTDDLDAVFKNLSAFRADGGGDEPESVNQALDEAVNKIAWSPDRAVLKIIFLVGDAPPHMDYAGEKQWAKAVKVVEALSLEHPTEVAFYDRAADIYGELKDDANAVCWFRRSFSISPDFEKARRIFGLYLKQDRPSDALPYLDYAIRNNTSGFNLAPVKQLAQEVIQLQQTSHKDDPDPAVLNSIAAKYLSMGNRDVATRYIDSVLKADPNNKEALALKGR